MVTRIAVQELEHAKLGASGSKRWLNCPGSIAFKEKDDKGGEAAWLGSVMHAVAEMVLNGEVAAPEMCVGLPVVRVDVDGTEAPVDTGFTPEMAKTVKPYTDYCLSLAKGATGHEVEMQVNLGVLLPHLSDVWGTVDFVSWVEWDDGTKEMVVVDLKTGNGPVGAQENTQLMIYALGAMGALFERDGFAPDGLSVVIVQPKVGGVKEWSVPVSRLKAFLGQVSEGVSRIEEVVNVFEDTGEVPEEYLNAGDWCRYCPAITACPAQARKIESFAVELFGQKKVEEVKARSASDLDDDQLGRLLEMAPEIEQWIKAARAEAVRRIGDGGHVPGFKLGKPRRTRRWVDPEAARRYLSGRGVELGAPSVAAAAKTVGDLPDDLWEWVESGKPALNRQRNPFKEG